MESFEDIQRQKKQERLSGGRDDRVGSESSRPLYFLLAGIGMFLASVGILSYNPLIALLFVGGLLDLKSAIILIVGHFATLFIRIPVMLLGLRVFGVGSASISSAALRIAAIAEFSSGVLSLAITLSLGLLGPSYILPLMALAFVVIFFVGWNLTSEFFDLDGLEPLWCWVVIILVDAAVWGLIKFVMDRIP